MQKVGLSGVASIALAAAACGGMSAAERGDCAAAIINGAAANVVIQAYEAGRLGSRIEVQRQLGGTLGVEGGKQYFTRDGHLRPYSSLNSDVLLGEFNHWMRFDPVLTVTGRQQLAAQEKARQRAGRECR